MIGVAIRAPKKEINADVDSYTIANMLSMKITPKNNAEP